MNVEFGNILATDTAAAYIGLVRQDQRGGNRIHGGTGGFVMLADGGDHVDPVHTGHIGLEENIVCQQCAQFRMVGTVDGIADVVHKACDFSQLLIVLGVAQFSQNIGAALCHQYINDAAGMGAQALENLNTMMAAAGGNIADMAASCGKYLQIFNEGIHYSFIASVAAMLISLTIFITNQKGFPTPAKKEKVESASYTEEEKAAMAKDIPTIEGFEVVNTGNIKSTGTGKDVYNMYPIRNGKVWFEKMPEIEADRAVILTRVYKETEGEPIITRRAKAFKAICEELPITIRPYELIVGSNAKSPRSCQVFPEYSFDWVEAEFETMETRSADPFHISEEAKQALHEAYKYWGGKTTSELASSYMEEETLHCLQ